MAQERHEWSEPVGARPPRGAVGRSDRDDLTARLERLEAVVTAIAEHLGVRPGRIAGPRRGPARQPTGRRVGAGEVAAGEERAVVRIVARGLTGRVKLYNAPKGYGFVVSPDAPGDVFFHRSDCRIDPSTLEPGAEVAFDLAEMANGQVKAVRLDAPQGRRAQDQPAAPGDDAGPRGSRPAGRQRTKETAAPLASQQPPL